MEVAGLIVKIIFRASWFESYVTMRILIKQAVARVRSSNSICKIVALCDPSKSGWGNASSCWYKLTGSFTVYTERLVRNALFHENFRSCYINMLVYDRWRQQLPCWPLLMNPRSENIRIEWTIGRAACSPTHFAGFSTTLNSKDGERADSQLHISMWL